MRRGTKRRRLVGKRKGRDRVSFYRGGNNSTTEKFGLKCDLALVNLIEL
jgi:hypothetical protein